MAYAFMVIMGLPVYAPPGAGAGAPLCIALSWDMGASFPTFLAWDIQSDPKIPVIPMGLGHQASIPVIHHR
jgi:hypothetical protein